MVKPVRPYKAKHGALFREIRQRAFPTLGTYDTT
jgi:hypothetical protein